MKNYLRYTFTYILCFIYSILFVYGQNYNSDKLSQLDNSLNEKYFENDFSLFDSDSLRILPPRTGSRTLKDEEFLLVEEENQKQTKSYSSSTRTLNTNYLVGTTAGNVNVTPSGAATYTIPLELPVGINGMRPNVSVFYNSQSPNGMLGYAWNLSAHSVISRTGKTYYHDGTTTTTQLSSSDNLMLDGQRLMLFSGTNLSSGAKYRTEIETFCDITYKSISGNLCFEVQTKDGLIMQYGTTADSRFEGQRGTVFCWLLQRVTDANGNYMTYSYEKNNTTGELYIKSIEYAGNTQAGITPVNKIEFIYVTRQDVAKSFMAGNQLSTTKILKNVKVTTSGTLFKEYTFNYSYNGFYTKLTEVVESFDNGNNRYNSTIIEWGSDRGMSSHNGYETRMHPINSFDQERRLYADFNGDGKMDFITFPKKDSDQYTKWDYASLYIRRPSSFDAGHQISLDTLFQDLQFGDFNGDGLMDIVKINKDKDKTEYKYTIFLFNGNSFIESYNFAAKNQTCLITDFDGDGKADILTGSILWINGVICNIDPQNRILYLSNVQLGDFTGNGKMNLLFKTTTNYEIYELYENNFIRIDEDNLIKSDDTLIMGDFNGDGKTDILVKKRNSEYYMLYANGRSYSPSDPIFQRKDLPNLKITGKCFVGDFNRDGKADIIFADIYSKTGENYPVKIGLFDGNNFHFTNYTTDVIPTASSDTKMNEIWASGKIIIADLDGDGRSDLLYDDNRPTVNIKSFPDKHTLFVRNITDGLNRKTSFEFSTIATDELNGYNHNGTYKRAPIIAGNIPLPVLTVLQTNAGEISSTTEFEYGRMLRHSQGKGFLCFQEITAYNFDENRRTTTKYSVSVSNYTPYATSVTTSTKEGQQIESVSYNNTQRTIAGKIIFPYVNSQVQTNSLTGLSNTIRFTVDENGNTTSIVVTGSIQKTTTIQYAQRGSWLPNKPTSITVANTWEGATQTRKTSYTYDAKGNLTKETIDPADQNSRIVEYKNFDAFGHPLTINTTANGKTRTSTYTYSASGRFLKSETNTLGNTTNYYWNETKGLPTSRSDYASTYYFYDAAGRLSNTIYPTGAQKNSKIAWANSGNKLYYEQDSISGTSPTRTYYNAAGMAILEENYGLNSQKISRFTNYLSNGKVQRISAPTFNSSPTDWDALYTYDALGRILSIHTPDGTTMYAYNGLTTTITSPSGTQKITQNSLGKTASSTVNGKSVTFQYYPSGLVKSTTPQGGQSIYLEYDLQGNRTKITDPDAGTIQSGYDGFGQLLWTKQQVHLTGDEITTTNNYAADGLLQSVNRNGEITSYTYDHWKRIKTIEIPDQHKQTYAYDNMHRLINVKEEIAGQTYTTSSTYDVLNRVKRETYPSGYYTENHYDNSGLLTSVTDRENRLVWQAEAENARGQILQEKRGTSSTYHTYNNKGLLTNSHNNVFDWSYGYDAQNNLSYRSDNLQGLQEDFLYDDLNRLYAWDISQHGNLLQSNAITYDALTGRITGKSDTGYSDMFYGEDNNKPHALTSHAFESETPGDLIASYTDFKKLKTLAEGDKLYILAYGVDQQRRVSVYIENNALVQTRYYIGSYEEKIDYTSGITEKIHYLSGGAIYIENSNGTSEFYFAYTDHLGSLIALTDYAGNIQERYAYDPWGNRRNPNNWAEKDERTTWVLNRGFTGHEHIDQFGIINMNGRVYDPLTAMFFSPDPYVQAPEDWLNYNRYSYCYGNPLKYTDPDGEFVHLIIGAFIGGGINLLMNKDKIDSAGAFFGYFGIGALGGALSAGMGAGISSAIAGGGFGAGFSGASSALTATSSFLSGAAIGGGAGFSGGFTLGFGNGLMSGQSFEEALWNGAKDGLWAGLSGAAIGGLVGGINASNNDASFWNGKAHEHLRDLDYDYGLSHMGQGPYSNDCLLNSLRAAQEDMGLTPTSVEGLRTDIGKINNEPITFGDMKKIGYNFKKIKVDTKLLDNLRTNREYVFMPMQIKGSDTGHMTILNKIEVWKKANSGKEFIKIFVMDPARGRYVRHSVQPGYMLIR